MVTQKDIPVSEWAKYPGIVGKEYFILKAWLAKHEAEYDEFDFNVRLGSGVDPGAGYADEIRQQAILNTQKRVDAVGYKDGAATLMEVKDRVTASAIGQLQTYAALWARQFPAQPTPALILICSRYDADMLAVLQHHGIQLQVVEAAAG